MTGFSELCLQNGLRLPFSQISPSSCRRRPATAITAGERSTDVRLGFHNCSNVALRQHLMKITTLLLLIMRW